MRSNEFDGAKSSKATFFVDGDKSNARPVRVMNATRRARYAFMGADSVQVLELPYDGEDLSMVFVLPKAVEGLAALQRTFDVERLGRWITALKETVVDISIPTFRIAPPGAIDLKSQLVELGVRKVFGICSAAASDARGPNFLPMAKGSFQLSGAYHQAFVEVDERGTAAASAPVVAVPTSAGRRPGPIRFRADHPFLFFVRDLRTNILLFLGHVVDPVRD